MKNTPWHHEPRIRLSEQKAAKLFVEHKGRCDRCGRKLLAGDDWIVEHVLALENGGTNDWSNLGITCAWCKPAKDAEDHAAAGHMRRAAAKHIVSKSMRKKSALAKKPGTKFDWRQGRYVRDETE
jgi:5-methylcytosine-specific restriction endonuclease McrA